ncbi:unnamed protein product [Symbiodinium sp. CCMP2456]|nr:unnamed protein product [Symbiodinium sp. CCMP2456]
MISSSPGYRVAPGVAPGTLRPIERMMSMPTCKYASQASPKPLHRAVVAPVHSGADATARSNLPPSATANWVAYPSPRVAAHPALSSTARSQLHPMVSPRIPEAQVAQAQVSGLAVDLLSRSREAFIVCSGSGPARSTVAAGHFGASPPTSPRFDAPQPQSPRLTAHARPGQQATATAPPRPSPSPSGPGPSLWEQHHQQALRQMRRGALAEGPLPSQSRLIPGGAPRQPARESKATVAHVQVTQPTDLLAPCETMTATTATAMTATTASLPSRSEHLPASMTQALETLQPEVPDVQPQAQADTAPTAPIFREARVGSGPQPSRPQPTRSQAPPGNSADTATAPRYEVQPTAKAKELSTVSGPKAAPRAPPSPSPTSEQTGAVGTKSLSCPSSESEHATLKQADGETQSTGRETFDSPRDACYRSCKAAPAEPLLARLAFLEAQASDRSNLLAHIQRQQEQLNRLEALVEENSELRAKLHPKRPKVVDATRRDPRLAEGPAAVTTTTPALRDSPPPTMPRRFRTAPGEVRTQADAPIVLTARTTPRSPGARTGPSEAKVAMVEQTLAELERALGLAEQKKHLIVEK